MSPVGALFTTFVLYLIHQSAGWLIARFSTLFGFDRLADIASLPLVILLFSLASIVFSPLSMAYSRGVEHEADRFGLGGNFKIDRHGRPLWMAEARL